METLKMYVLKLSMLSVIHIWMPLFFILNVLLMPHSDVGYAVSISVTRFSKACRWSTTLRKLWRCKIHNICVLFIYELLCIQLQPLNYKTINLVMTFIYLSNLVTLAGISFHCILSANGLSFAFVNINIRLRCQERDE